jgi:HEAT repeat protein
VTAPDLPVLSPAETQRLTEFARGLKAAARAVTLYPKGHPAIAATLGRVVQITSPAALSAPLRINVLADALTVDGHVLPRPDAAVTELAVILHSQLIGEMLVYAGGEVEDWRNFLLLLARPPDEVRAEGGIARLWTTVASRHLELREIDYAEVLRERRRGEAAAWEDIIANCLQGDASDLDEETIAVLLETAGDPEKVRDLLAMLEAKAVEMGRGATARGAALVRLMTGIMEALAKRSADQTEPVLNNLAAAVGHVSPEVMVSLLGTAAPGPGGEQPPAGALVRNVVNRMTDESIAGFVSRNALGQDSSIERVAQAFQTLVVDQERRERLLTLAHDEAAQSPLGGAENFETMWDRVAEKVLKSYSDKPYVPDAYAHELSNARTQAISVDQSSDDPPERKMGWLRTVATSELRKLDLTLVLDLLRIEEDPERWAALMKPVVGLIEDLFLVGDFDGAEALVGALVAERHGDPAAGRASNATAAIDALLGGPMMRHLSVHLSTVDDLQFERVKTMLLPLGEILIRPLVEALLAEERSRSRERMTAMLIGFGILAKREIERLKNSPNPLVRRTAIHLLREFGGNDALPELTELLNDREQGVQRDAVRAIINVGTEDAYQVLQQALSSGTPQSREAIMQSVGVLRDERAAPLYVYILRHVDHRGQLGWIYARAIDALGALKDPESVPALKDALYRGEWWAPRRTSALRAAAAAALARIGTAGATAVLEQAARSGLRGVRAAARTQLTTVRTRRAARAE